MFQNTIVTIYLACSVAFAVTTFLEGWMNRDDWTLARACGIIGSIAWPFMLAFFFVHSLLTRTYSNSAQVVLCEYRASNSRRPTNKA